jgi:hypothetical protein
MPFCSKCGSQHQDEAQFCPNCGNTVAKNYGNATQSDYIPNQNRNVVASDNQVKKRFVFYVFGYLCYVFAIIDFVTGNFFGYDITGVFWSPILACAIGTSVLVAIAYNKQKLEFLAALPDGESIIRSGMANWKKISGKLYLTTHRLYFSGIYIFSGLYIELRESQFAEELKIEIEQIKDVSFYSTTGLAITTLDGEKIEFIVYGRKLWKEEIEKIKSKTHEKRGG